MVPAFFHCVKIWQAPGEVSDSDVSVFPQQLPDQLCPMRGGPVRYHGNPSKMSLQILQVSGKGLCVKPVIGSEELPPVPCNRSVYCDLPVASGMGHVTGLATGGQHLRPVAASCTKNASSSMTTTNPSFSMREIHFLMSCCQFFTVLPLALLIWIFCDAFGERPCRRMIFLTYVMCSFLPAFSCMTCCSMTGVILELPRSKIILLSVDAGMLLGLPHLGRSKRPSRPPSYLRIQIVPSRATA